MVGSAPGSLQRGGAPEPRHAEEVSDGHAFSSFRDRDRIRGARRCARGRAAAAGHRSRAGTSAARGRRFPARCEHVEHHADRDGPCGGLGRSESGRSLACRSHRLEPYEGRSGAAASRRAEACRPAAAHGHGRSQRDCRSACAPSRRRFRCAVRQERHRRSRSHDRDVRVRAQRKRRSGHPPLRRHMLPALRDDRAAGVGAGQPADRQFRLR